MDQTVTVDCGTGEVVAAAPTEADIAAVQTHAATATKKAADHATLESLRESVIAKVAAVAGVPVDDLKAAFGAGQRAAKGRG